MGRGRAKGKGKKPSVSNQEDAVSGAGEKIPAQKRRGKRQKSARDGIEEDDESLKIEDEDSEDTSVKETKSNNTAMTSNGKKRKRNAQVKDKVFDLVKERNGTADSNESNGFRQTGNRRKNKPHRAAEAVVECN